jgi:methionyl-tRNA formyltransferase
VTYAAKISKDEARIDWSRPRRRAGAPCAGLAPFPGAWFEVGGRADQAGSRAKAMARRAGGGLDDRLTIACGWAASRRPSSSAPARAR